MTAQLSPQELLQRLAGRGSRPVVLDVRESWERQLCALPDSAHIPMNQVPQCLDKLDKNTEIVVLCHFGARSQQVAEFLERRGFDKVFNLRGGIDAWATDVDPEMPKY